MSDAAIHDDEGPELTVVGPKDALRMARPLPPDEVMRIDDLTEEESEAFIAALQSR